MLPHPLHIYTEDAFARDIVLRAFEFEKLANADIKLSFSNGDGGLRKDFLAHYGAWQQYGGALPLAMPDGDEGGRRLAAHQDMQKHSTRILPIGDDRPEDLTAIAIIAQLDDLHTAQRLTELLARDHHAIFSRMADLGLYPNENTARDHAVRAYLTSAMGTAWRQMLARFITMHSCSNLRTE